MKKIELKKFLEIKTAQETLEEMGIENEPLSNSGIVVVVEVGENLEEVIQLVSSEVPVVIDLAARIDSLDVTKELVITGDEESKNILDLLNLLKKYSESGKNNPVAEVEESKKVEGEESPYTKVDINTVEDEEKSLLEGFVDSEINKVISNQEPETEEQSKESWDAVEAELEGVTEEKEATTCVEAASEVGITYEDRTSEVVVKDSENNDTEEVPFSDPGKVDPETLERPGKGRVALVDLHNYLHKMYYGAKPTAAHCVSVLLKTLSKRGYEKVVFASDSSTSARKEFYSGYKDNKEEKPKELQVFLREVSDILVKATAFSTFIEIEKYEADDIIAAYVHSMPEALIDLLTTDKDLYQLINDNVRVVDILQKVTYSSDTNNLTIKKVGVEPKFIRLFLSITGDASDNIPGIKGVGKDSAIKLINESQATNFKEFVEWINSLDLDSKLPVQKRFVNLVLKDQNETEHRKLEKYSDLQLSWLLSGLKKDLSISLEVPSFSENRDEMAKFL